MLEHSSTVSHDDLQAGAQSDTTAPQHQTPRRFRYRAVEAGTGTVHTGEQEGESAYAVRSALRKIGLEVEHIEAVKASSLDEHGLLPALQRSWHAHLRQKRLTQRADIFDALATMLGAGLALEQALSNVAAATTRKTTEQRMLRHLRDRVRDGNAFSDACRQHPDWFDPIDIAIIEAGQHGGELATALRAQSTFLLQRSGMQHRLIAALVYPLILLLAACGVTLFLSVNTLPQLIQMISSAQLDVPLLTSIVAGGGQLVWHWWWLIALIMLTLVLGLRLLFKALPEQNALKQFAAQNILVRTLHRNRVAQVATTLARLQRSGIPLADALYLVASSAPSTGIRTLLENAAASIESGSDFSQAISASQLLDAEFAQLLQLGEESGELPSMLERIAERYQRAAERSTEMLAAFLEPVAVLTLAVLIGCIAMAAVLPLMEMTKAL